MFPANITRPTSQGCGYVLGFGQQRAKMLVYFDFSGLCTYNDYLERAGSTQNGHKTLFFQHPASE